MAIFGFDDVVNVEESSYKLLAEGPAAFKITDFKRGLFGGSAKLEPGPQAELTLLVTDKNGANANVPLNIPLNSALEWKITALFVSVGLLEPGAHGDIRYSWGELKGRMGACIIRHRTWTGKDGAERTSNDIARFLPRDSQVDE